MFSYKFTESIPKFPAKILFWEFFVIFSLFVFDFQISRFTRTVWHSQSAELSRRHCQLFKPEKRTYNSRVLYNITFERTHTARQPDSYSLASTFYSYRTYFTNTHTHTLYAHADWRIAYGVWYVSASDSILHSCELMDVVEIPSAYSIPMQTNHEEKCARIHWKCERRALRVLKSSSRHTQTHTVKENEHCLPMDLV